MNAFVIIGASGGIGSELCRRLSTQGAKLVLAARDEAKLHQLASELPGESHVYPVNITESAAVDGLFEFALQTLGTIHGVAHMVGSIILKPAHLTSDAEWEQTLTLNLSSAFYTLRAAVKAMTSNGGSLLLTSTVAAEIGLPNHEAIAAAKGGIDALVRSAAATYANRNIRINAIAPGLVRTPLSARLTASEVSLKASTAMHPIGRIGEPADIASLAAFLLDPAHSWITGQILSVDGGMATVRGR